MHLRKVLDGMVNVILLTLVCLIGATVLLPVAIFALMMELLAMILAGRLHEREVPAWMVEINEAADSWAVKSLERKKQ